MASSIFHEASVFLAKTRYSYMKKFLSYLTTDKHLKNMIEFYDDLTDYKEEDLKKNPHLIEQFEELKKIKEESEDFLITHDEVLNYISMLRVKYDNSSILTDTYNFIQEKKENNHLINLDDAYNILQVKYYDEHQTEHIIFPDTDFAQCDPMSSFSDQKKIEQQVSQSMMDE